MDSIATPEMVKYEVNGMTIEAPVIEGTEAWSKLIHESRDSRAKIAKASVMLIEGYFDLGCKLLEFKTETNKLGAYGDNVVDSFVAHFNKPENLLNGMRLHKTGIYEAVTLAEDCDGDQANLESLLDQLEQRNKSRTWTSIRNRKQLLGGKTSKADPEQARSQGGEVQQAHNLLADLESAHILVHEYSENGIPEDQKKQVAGATATLALEAVALAEKIQPGIIFKESSIAPAFNQEPMQMAEVVEQSIEEDLSAEFIDSKFLSELYLVPCVVGQTLGEPCEKDHTRMVEFPGTEGDLIVLCGQHTEEYQKRGAVAFFSSYRSEIFAWYSFMMRRFHRQSLEWREEALQLENKEKEPF